MVFFYFILIIIAAGICLWAINRYLPMEPLLKGLLNVVVIILVVYWSLKTFGVL